MEATIRSRGWAFVLGLAGVWIFGLSQLDPGRSMQVGMIIFLLYLAFIFAVVIAAGRLHEVSVRTMMELSTMTAAGFLLILYLLRMLVAEEQIAVAVLVACVVARLMHLVTNTVLQEHGCSGVPPD